MFIEGNYLDGHTAKRHRARLAVNAEHQITHVHLLDSQQDISFEQQHYIVETRLGNTPREITFADGQLFTCPHQAEINALISWKISAARRQNTWLPLLENNLKVLISAIFATFILLYALVTYGIPSTAKLIAHHGPDITSERMISTLDILDASVFEPSLLADDRQQQILKLVKPYLQANTTLVFRAGMKANALALPNGAIVFTDDFVNLTRSDNELLAVLFHEMGHLTHKHMTQRIIQDAMLTILTIYIIGDLGSADILAGLPTLLLDLSYSRAFEIEADNYALTQLSEHNIPLQSFINVMQNIEQYHVAQTEQVSHQKAAKENIKGKRHLSDFFSTHPTTQARIDLVNAFNAQALSAKGNSE